MAKLEFQSAEAAEHFKKLVAHAIDNGSYFGERGLHERLEYLRRHGDQGAEYVREGDIITQHRVMIGWGSTPTDANIAWQSRTISLDKVAKKDGWTEWTTTMYGGLIGHRDGTWATHT